MITYFKDKNHKSKKKHEVYKNLNTLLESKDTIVFIGTTSTSITLSITKFGLIILPVSVAIACALLLCNKVLHKLIVNTYNKYKKQYEKDQLTIKSFNMLYRKSSKDYLIDRIEYESLCNMFTEYVDETKIESLWKIWTKSSFLEIINYNSTYNNKHRNVLFSSVLLCFCLIITVVNCLKLIPNFNHLLFFWSVLFWS